MVSTATRLSETANAGSALYIVHTLYTNRNIFIACIYAITGMLVGNVLLDFVHYTYVFVVPFEPRH